MTGFDTTDDSESDLSETNWTPTRVSTAIALLGTVGGVTALSAAVGVTTGAVVGVAGAVGLAVAVWLLTFEQWRVPATLAASLLLVPAGAAISVGVGYELLVAFAASFPATSPTGVVGQMLRIGGVMATLGGCTLAVFGAAASVRGVATDRNLSQCLDALVKVSVLPVGFFFALAGHALVTNFDLAGGAVGHLVSTLVRWLFDPVGDGIAGFWLLFVAATYATYRALAELPTRQIAGEATVGRLRVADLVDVLEHNLSRLAALGLLGLPPAFLVGVVLPAEPFRDVAPGSTYESVVGVTTAPGLRHLLFRVALVAGVVAVVAAVARRSSRTSIRSLMVGYAPFLAGMAVVAGVGVVHESVVGGLVGFVAERLTGPLSDRFRQLSDGVVQFYGSETVVLGLTAAVVFLTAFAVFAVWLTFALGFVSNRVAGPSLAGGGLFIAAAFAGTAGASSLLVVAGLVVGLVVWDAGEFATTLGEEVGRQAETRRVELLHALGAISVGVLGAVAAGLLTGLVSSGASSGGLDGVSFGLLGAVAAVVVLIMALR